MPRVKSVEREDVLRAAIELVRKRGENALNARSIAEEIGCSTQPVYSLFRNMEELRAALAEEGKARYRKYIDGYLSGGEANGYKSYGLGFARFAREEKELFRLIFLGGNDPQAVAGDPFFEEEILDAMVELLKAPRETVRRFHADMSVYSYGLAVHLNKGSLWLTDEEVSEALNREFYALYALYFPERPRLGR